MQPIREEQSQSSHCDASSASSNLPREAVPPDEPDIESPKIQKRQQQQQQQEQQPQKKMQEQPTPRRRNLHGQDDDSSDDDDGPDKDDLMTDESMQLYKFEQEILARSAASGCGSETSSSDGGNADKWENEISRSVRSIGTEPHDNRSNKLQGSSIRNVDWGHNSIHMDAVAYNKARDNGGIYGDHHNLQHNQASGAIYFEDTWKNEYTEADYVCFGCIRRECSSSNPAMAVLVICIQLVAVIVFTLLFMPNHNDHGVTNTTGAMNGDNREGSMTSTPSVLMDGIFVITIPPIGPVEELQPTQPVTVSITTGPPAQRPPTTTTTTTAAPQPPPTPVTLAPGSPTVSPNGMTLFLSWLPPDTQEVINSDISSPQARAFDYMLQDPNYGTYTQERIIQRFALATLFYATKGDQWKQNTGWLSYDLHECDWQQSSTSATTLALYDSTSVQVCSSIFTSDTSERSYQSLQLANNYLEGRLPPELQLLTNLQILDVSQNYEKLQGNLPDVIFEKCTRLRDVVVFENQLTGSIPTALGGLTNLQSFHAWDNQFVGPAFVFTTDDLFQKVTNLRQWHVGNNQLTGTIPSSSSSSTSTPGTSSSLESLWLYGNQISGSIPSDIAAWAGGLTSFLAWGNKLSGSLPTELGLLSLVEQLDLEENVFGGTIPSELGLLSTSLKSLWLSRNNLSGLIPSQLSQLPGLTILSLHSNKLIGRVLPSLGLLTSLYELTLQNNEFTGVIPTQLGNLMRTLRELQLGNNQLSGPIPTEIGRLFNLQRVQLQNNQLSGTVPSQFGALKALQECSLQNNQLRSVLPTELGLLTQLTGLTVNQNAFTGRIPAELGGLSSKLKVLDVSSNQFSGLIPFALFPLVGGGSRHSLEELILADNNLNGPIPTGVGALGRLTKLDLGQNELTSFLPSEIGQLSALSSLNLSSNQLMWTIPTEIGLLYSLEMLLLDFNNFAGAMPSEVGTLQQLKSLHLNDNPFLFGPIPEGALASLTDLQELTLNGTGLTGTLPDETCFLELLEVDCATTFANTRSGVCGCDCAC